MRISPGSAMLSSEIRSGAWPRWSIWIKEIVAQAQERRKLPAASVTADAPPGETLTTANSTGLAFRSSTFPSTVINSCVCAGKGASSSRRGRRLRHNCNMVANITVFVPFYHLLPFQHLGSTALQSGALDSFAGSCTSGSMGWTALQSEVVTAVVSVPLGESEVSHSGLVAFVVPIFSGGCGVSQPGFDIAATPLPSSDAFQ